MKKSSILLIIPASIALISCGRNQESSNNTKSDHETRIIEDEEVEDLKQHATSISATPNASFYLKVGDTRDVSVTLSPSPDDDEEKKFNWTTRSDVLSVTQDSKSPNKAVIKALKEGSGSVLATNTYDESLKSYFNVNAIELDDENSYLWQYESEDRKQFGYPENEKLGYLEGDAVLGNMTWHYTRSQATSLQSRYGGLGFGKGSAPEEHVKLVAENNRLIDKIVVEACSSKGLADIKVKVGDVSVIDQKCTDRDFNDIMTRFSSYSSLSKLEGDISIEFDTPAYDSTRATDPTYTIPGAVYLKSILIYYAPEEEPEYVTDSTLDFIDIFQNKDSNQDFWSGIVASTAKEKNYCKDGINYYFEKIKAPNDAEYFNTNGKIVINVPEDQVIYRVDLKTVKLSSTKNVYNGFGSLVGGEPYSCSLGSGTENELSFKVTNKHINSVMLKNSGSANIGLVSLNIKTIAGTHAEIKDVKFPEGSTPTKVKYSIGEKFEPAGLSNAVASFTDSSIKDIQIPIESFKFYEGASYDANPATAVEELNVNTTYVYAVYKTFALKIEGLTVADIQIELTKVKNISDILSNGKYYLVSTDKKVLLKGSSAGDMKSESGIASLGDNFDFEDTISLPGIYKNDYLQITQESGGYALKCNAGNMIGMTASGNISTAANPGLKLFNISINSETSVVTFEISTDGDDPITKYLVFGDKKLTLVEENSANISIYKVAE